jgi:site-specific recombinase XerD
MSIEIVKRKKGVGYKATLYISQRKAATKTFDRKVDARQWLENKEQQLAFGHKGSIKFKEAALQWLNNHSKIRRSPASHAEDQRMLEKEIIPFFNKLDIDLITPTDIESYITSSTMKGRKNPTTNRYLQCLRAIFNYSIKKRYVLYNVVSIVGLLPEHDNDFDYLNFEDTKMFLEFSNLKYRTNKRWVYRLYLVAINCGLRWGEIIALKWDKVDFNRNMITIARSYCNKARAIRETTKARNIRHVGITTALMPELRSQYNDCSNKTGLIFPSYNGNPIQIANFKRDHFDKDLLEAGIRKIRFHDLRHTFASHFVMKGGNIYDLQRLLGHSNIKTTERYAHLSPDHSVTKTEIVSIDGNRIDNVVPLRPQQHSVG